nr:uncharacterized protein LOC123281103 [Equus asinus]
MTISSGGYHLSPHHCVQSASSRGDSPCGITCGKLSWAQAPFLHLALFVPWLTPTRSPLRLIRYTKGPVSDASTERPPHTQCSVWLLPTVRGLVLDKSRVNQEALGTHPPHLGNYMRPGHCKPYGERRAGPGRPSTHLRRIHRCCRLRQRPGTWRAERNPERRATRAGPEGSAWAGSSLAACCARSPARKWCRRLTGRRPPPSGPQRRSAGAEAWANARSRRRLADTRREGSCPTVGGTVPGEWSGGQGARLAPGAAVASATSLSFPARPHRSGHRAALQSTWSWSNQPPLPEGCPAAAIAEAPPDTAGNAPPGPSLATRSGGSAEHHLLGSVVWTPPVRTRLHPFPSPRQRPSGSARTDQEITLQISRHRGGASLPLTEKSSHFRGRGGKVPPSGGVHLRDLGTC